MYLISERWLWHWVKVADQLKQWEVPSFGKLGCSLYISRLRHFSAQKELLSVFQAVFSLKMSVDEVVDNAKRAAAEPPYVLTPNVLCVWKQMAASIHAPQPVLLTGDEGCGKSDCVRAFATVLNKEIHQLCLTPETEPASLVGQMTPNSQATTPDERIIWRDGIVTDAFSRGGWVLLDNLSQAESSVLERLNPVVWLYFLPFFVALANSLTVCV